MGLNRYRLGDYIERSTANNHNLRYSEELIVGVTSEGVFSSPKGNVNGVDLTPYKIVNNGDFVYNPSRFDLGSIAYRTEGLCIVSHLYQIFHLNEKGKKSIDPFWLYIYLRRLEFRREVTFRNFGSQRPEFNFNDLSEIELPLPDIDAQRKFVNIYLAIQKNILAYQSKAEELKLVCDGYIEELRRQMPCKTIGNYIQQKKDRNSDKKISDVWGVSTTRQFIEASSAVDKNNLSNYKIVDYGDIAYVPTTHLKVYAIAISDKEEPFVVSPIYEVFAVKDKNRLDPEYLYLWLCRDEIMRYAFYNSWGSARENFNYDDMCTVKIPIPSIEIQRDIVNIHRCYIERQRIAAELKEHLDNLYPILIKGSLQSNN